MARWRIWDGQKRGYFGACSYGTRREAERAITRMTARKRDAATKGLRLRLATVLIDVDGNSQMAAWFQRRYDVRFK